MSTRDTIVVPPVEAGTIESCIDVEYDHRSSGEGGFVVRGDVSWEFDNTALYEYTGVDESDVPLVGSNRETLQKEVQYQVMNNDDGRWTVRVSEYGHSPSRGHAAWNTVVWYDIEDGVVTETHVGFDIDRENGYEPTFRWPDLQGYSIPFGVNESAALLDFVSELHFGHAGATETIRGKCKALIEAFAPENGIHFDVWQHEGAQERAVSSAD